MLKGCAEHVERLWKTLGQVGGLCTLSTAAGIIGFNRAVFYHVEPTVPTQKGALDTQPLKAALPLLDLGLYPVSTAPMNTTNLIKG
jgi:hypothetical protein